MFAQYRVTGSGLSVQLMYFSTFLLFQDKRRDNKTMSTGSFKSLAEERDVSCQMLCVLSNCKEVYKVKDTDRDREVVDAD